MTTDFRQGVKYERARIVGGIRYLLDNGGGVDDVRTFLDNIENRPSVVSQLKLIDDLGDVEDLVGRMATALDAYQRYIHEAILNVRKTPTGFDFDFRVKDRAMHVKVVGSGRVQVDCFERAQNVQVRDFGVVEDFDALVVPLRAYVEWLDGRSELDT